MALVSQFPIKGLVPWPVWADPDRQRSGGVKLQAKALLGTST